MSFVARIPSDPHSPRGRRRRLRSLAILPTLLTLGNLTCGFAAVHFALRAMYDLGAGVTSEVPSMLPGSLMERMLPSFISVGAGLILLGMFLDAFDGLIARVTRSTTTFGGQLDSLADVVSFGVAPAILMVALMTKELAADKIMPSPISEHLLGRIAWISAAIYVSFAAIRLARFNVEHARADHDYRLFRGIPSPGAAAVMVALIVFQDQPAGAGFRPIMVYVFPPVAVTLGLLMVSRIPYRRFHRAYLLGRQPFEQVLFVLVLFAVFWVFKAPMLLLIVLWYALSGPLFLAVRWSRDRWVARSRPASDESSERKRA